MKHLPIIILAAALCIAGCGQNKQKEAGAPETKAEETVDLSEYAPKIEKGSEAYDISAKTPEGEDFLLSSLRGNYVVVDFWASWCPDCRRANPFMLALYRKYHNKGLEFIGVSLDNKRERWTAAIAADTLTWTHVSSLKGWECPVAVEYNIHWIPTAVLIDREGRVVCRGVEGEALEAKIKEILK